jgi:hypothetical protein
VPGIVFAPRLLVLDMHYHLVAQDHVYWRVKDFHDLAHGCKLSHFALYKNLSESNHITGHDSNLKTVYWHREKLLKQQMSLLISDKYMHF